MASINQLVSEIAHSFKQPDSVPVRRAIKLGIIHARNELIRKSYTNHNYIDKGLQQRFKLTLVNVPDSDLYGSKELDLPKIKRTANKVPRPVRLTNNLPFHSVRTSGIKKPIEIPFIKEASARYYASLPGMCSNISYDYTNEYIYINYPINDVFKNLNAIIVESVFEYPHIIPIETNEKEFNINSVNDDDEFLLPEDMIGAVKKLITETWIIENIRDTNVVPSPTIAQ